MTGPMRQTLIRAAAIAFAFFVGSCAALFPKQVSTEERLAVFPTAGLPIEKPVVIRWNAYQVPFVEAQTDRDLAFALGLVHAHLRLFQIQAAKRLMSGRASESGGPVFVPEVDRALRTLNVRHSAAAMVAAMPAETRAYMQAFVDGVNYYQRQMKELPPEFGLLALGREEVTIEDVVAVSRVAGVDISWGSAINLMSRRDDPDYDAILARLLNAGAGPTVSFDSPGQAQALLRFFEENSRSGSNSFAVSPTRSASGGALIASDPHLGVTLPNLWVLAGIKSPSFNGVGLMIPGTPFIALGRTPDIAWGGTNMRASHSEFYDVSKLPASEIVETRSTVSKRLWFSEEIAARWAKGYGPIMSDTILMRDAVRPGETVAVRWIGHEVTDEVTAIMNAARAKTPEQFREALKTFALPAQNMIYADATGNVAQVTATMLPRRAYTEFPRDVVVPATPEYAWKDILDATELPWTLNPADGFIASANNVPYPQGGDVRVGWFFTADERIRRLKEMLSADSSVTLDDLKRMQLDTVSPFVREMLPVIRRAIEETPGAREIDPGFVARLLAFDADYKAGSTSAPAFEAFLYHFAPRVFGAETPADAPSWKLGWNGLGKTFAADVAAMTPEARAAAVKAAIEKAAEDAKAYPTWGDMHRLRVAHYLGAIPGVGGFFRYADLPTGGSRETVFKAAHGLVNGLHNTSYGSQSRHLSDLSDLDANYFVLLGGNDAWIGSANFLDQVELWQRGEYIRMPLRPETIAAEFPFVMTLTPAAN